MNGRPYQIFLQRVHRRRLLIGAFENLGLCVLVGCLLGTPLIIVLVFRDQSLLMPLVIIGFLVAVAAGAISVSRRPDLLATAIEADRQLHLADLLATAMQLDQNLAASDVMADQVLVMADNRCRGISPSAVILNRFGARGWGGIGLAVAMAMAVSLIPAHPIGSAAANERANSLVGVGQFPIEVQAAKPVFNSSVPGENTDDHSMSSARDDITKEKPAKGGIGKSEDLLPGSPKFPKTDSVGTISGDAMNGAASGGSGSAAKRGIKSMSSKGSSGSDEKEISSWKASDSSQPGAPVENERADDKIPSADRDLVREYFDHH